MAADDYLEVLRALRELPFGVGRRLLVDVLRGNEREMVTRSRLHRLAAFGALSGYDAAEIEAMIERLAANRLLEQAALPHKQYVKVYALTAAGKAELAEPRLAATSVQGRVLPAAAITEQERKLFAAFDFFLRDYTDEQKKAITSAAERILCVAGAGSGKTLTLTKRIEFLVRFRSIKPERILAITFTRKARKEMEERLAAAGIAQVQVETFNSFCEKALLRHTGLAYGKEVRVLSFGERVRLLRESIEKIGRRADEVLLRFYSFAQRRGKTDEELFYRFVYDCFSVLEHRKTTGKQLADFSQKRGIAAPDRANAQLVHQICTAMQEAMGQQGLRDYADQLLDALRLFAEHPETMPRYEHVLVDEYQDVNAQQVRLLEALGAPNLFCVGDPRQSIFGWRGSTVQFLLEFPQRFGSSEVVHLSRNYRSGKELVELMNAAIRTLRLPDIEAAQDGGKVVLVPCDDEEGERAFAMQKILENGVARNEIFVLARTNRQLDELQAALRAAGIPHLVRSEDQRSERVARQDEVTLATVHAIKGMEASLVLVIGCSSLYFPCKASDHPIIDLVKELDYDREEEERRLFYVAISRAKEQLYLLYAGNLTRFVTPEMQALMEKDTEGAPIAEDAFDRLKQWRNRLAQETGVPAYVILSNDTLLEIAARKPETAAELEQIRGIGPVKLQKYGKGVLDALWLGASPSTS